MVKPEAYLETDRGGGHASKRDAVERVVYASQANITQERYAEMENIRASALRHNPPEGIATALLYQSGWFVQWKEGPGDALERLMDRVSRDRRHHSLRVVHSSHGPRLLTGPWSMAIVQRAEEAADMAQRVNLARERLEAGVRTTPAAVWRQLSTPMQHRDAERLADPDGFQRVLVCASHGAASFALVHWLARRSEQEIVHRRFAGAQDRDVGTDLVDFSQDGRVVRLVAMARGGLALSLTCALMPDYSHVLLLLCGNHSEDLELIHSVAKACADLEAPPVLVGIAEHEIAHLEPFAVAHRLGLIYLKCQADPYHFATTWSAAYPVLSLWHETEDGGTHPNPLLHGPKSPPSVH
jgi:hypothetical protein